jgi:hypothetical protein
MAGQMHLPGGEKNTLRVFTQISDPQYKMKNRNLAVNFGEAGFASPRWTDALSPSRRTEQYDRLPGEKSVKYFVNARRDEEILVRCLEKSLNVLDGLREGSHHAQETNQPRVDQQSQRTGKGTG